jgi:formamidopyrimidine-DNA glycosylase
MPEVEALAGFLRERAVGHAVDSARVTAISALKTFDPPLHAIEGRLITGAARHGKFVDLEIGAPAGDEPLHLVFHLARAGWLRWYDELPATVLRPGKSPIALRVRLDDGSGFDLTEAGTRKRLAVHVVRDVSDVEQVRTLGVDALSPEFTAQALGALMRAKNQQVKGLLRDQHAIAGIGNAYSDEILHVARTSPFRLTGTYDDTDVAALHAAATATLRDAVATSSGRPAAELKDAKRAGMRVHGRTGQPCPVCGDTVREVSFADSSLQYCPTCQTDGKILADRRLSKLVR